MTAPLPLKYGKNRSLVDKTRIRWAGLGNVLLGLLFLAAEGLDTTIIGVLFLALGVAVWWGTRFGTVSFTALRPPWKAIVVVGAVGFLFLAMFHLLWLLINKIVDSLTSK